MNKQIAILATACLAISLVVAASSILPRVFAQREMEDAIRSMPSITNATTNQKTLSFPVQCNVQTMSQGAKWEDHCKLPNEAKMYPFVATCAAADVGSGKDLELACDLKPIR